MAWLEHTRPLLLPLLIACAAALAGAWLVYGRRRRRGSRLRAVQAGALRPGSISVDAASVRVVGPNGPPVRLDRYTLVERLGDGGMAEVFTALSRHGQAVVIKRLREELASDPTARAQLASEARIGAELAHPNIVTTLASGLDDGDLFLVQEYVPGRDLGRLTRRMVERKERPLSAAAILHIAHEVLGALDHAHGKGVVHCDVTPENIVITATGLVKLLDFGIAERPAPAAEGPAPIKGNVDFMAPEQASGRSLDGRADLFSLGAVIYFCAARGPLVRGPSLESRLAQAVAGPGARELALVEGLPHPLPSLLPRALAVDPEHRYRDAAELRAALAPHLADGAAELAAAIRRHFGDELAAEERRLAGESAPPSRTTLAGPHATV